MLSSLLVRLRPAAVCVAILQVYGCGGRPADPFPNRTAVTGTLSVDGQPVQWGFLSLTGQRDAETQQVALVRLPVRDGKFETEKGTPGPTKGTNQAEVIVFAEEPREDIDRPKVRGMWGGTVTVEEGQPLTIDIVSSELQKSLAQ